MTTITLTLDYAIKSQADENAHHCGFASTEEYLTRMIESHIALPVSPNLEATLLEALDEPEVEWTPDDFAQMKRELTEQHTKKRNAS